MEGDLASHCVISRTRELDQFEVSKNLELLAYFRSHVLIARMNTLQIGFVLIELLKRELGLSELSYGREDVKRPAPHGRRHLCQFSYTRELPRTCCSPTGEPSVTTAIFPS